LEDIVSERRGWPRGKRRREDGGWRQGMVS
jgi:hypothetical protein